MQSASNPRFPRTIVIGGGAIGKILSAAIASRSTSAPILVDAPRSGSQPELPYVCSHLVIDFLSRELPAVSRRLDQGGARRISIAAMLNERFPAFAAAPRDERTLFLCLSSSLLGRALDVEMDRVDRRSDRLTEILRHDGRVTGVRCENGRVLEAELVIDATGSGFARQRWFPGEHEVLRGPSYVSLSRFFRTPHPARLRFELVSGQDFRGGIYPLENDRFAIALILPERLVPTEDRADAKFDDAVRLVPNAGELIASSTDATPLQILRGIRNRKWDFYERSPMPTGFLPIGDSVLSGNPIYGRGLSLAIVQVAQLLSLLDAGVPLDSSVFANRMRASFRRARAYWADGARADRADEENRPLIRLVRDAYVKTVIPQLQSDPALMRRFLYNYQLMIPSWRITGPRQALRGLRDLIMI